MTITQESLSAILNPMPFSAVRTNPGANYDHQTMEYQTILGDYAAKYSCGSAIPLHVELERMQQPGASRLFPMKERKLVQESLRRQGDSHPLDAHKIRVAVRERHLPTRLDILCGLVVDAGCFDPGASPGEFLVEFGYDKGDAESIDNALESYHACARSARWVEGFCRKNGLSMEALAEYVAEL